jgi:hypothetical protein
MIREFAIEPEVMATWPHFREIFDDLGVCHGRLAAMYPADWIDRVRRLALSLSPPVRAAAIAERMRQYPDRFIRAGRAFDKGKDWLANAESHAVAGGFDGVVARKNPRDKSRVLVAGQFSRSQPPWHVPRQKKVARDAAAFARCAALLLASSEEIMLVEPNLDASEPRFKDPLMTLLGMRASGKPWRRCELHVDRPPNDTALENRKYNAQRQLAEVVPTGTTVRLHFWLRKTGGEKLHPRFLLTELGGIQFDYGLDAGDAPGDTTIVTLMDHDLWQAVRADYTVPSPSFTITSDCIVGIVGQA